MRHFATTLRSRLQPKRDWPPLVAGALLALLVIGGVIVLNRPPKPLSFGQPGITAAWIPDTVKRWEEPINEMAKAYNLDPTVLAIIMTLESGGYSKAASEAEAKGLMQITPPTAGDIASRHLNEPVTEYDLTNPRVNIEFGAAYLAMLRDEFGDPSHAPTWNETMELVAASYNGGPSAGGRLWRGEGLTNTEPVVYSRDAFNMWRERHAPTSPTYDRWLERGGQRLIDLAKTEQL